MTMRNSTLKFVVNPRPESYGGPLVILTDELSGSTSEIFTGGMKDLGRARIIGTRTMGAALPSVIEKLPNGDGFQYAFANYESAGGIVLEGNGIDPDDEIRLDRTKLLGARDAALEAAVAWIRAGARKRQGVGHVTRRSHDAIDRSQRSITLRRERDMLARRFNGAVRLIVFLVIGTALMGVIGCGGHKKSAVVDTITEAAQSETQPASGKTAGTEMVPSAADILDRYVEVTGGESAYSAVHNRHVIGTFEMPAMAISGTLEMWQAEPNLMRTLVDIGGMGSQAEGSDGNVIWEHSSMMGARIKEGVERAEALRRSTFNGEVKWRELFTEVKTLGEEDLNGTATYKVELTPAEGKPETRWFAKDSGLMLQGAATMLTQMGEIPVVSTFEDYREVDGIKFPFKLMQKMAVQEIVITSETIEHNVELADGIFDAPDEVKALMK